MYDADTPAESRRAPRGGDPPPRGRRQGGFTLVELVIVVVIVGIIAAIAIPRFSRASSSARITYVQESISVVRRGIELYYAEHGRYPGYAPATGAPSGADFVRQLTRYSDEHGKTQETRSSVFIYGPYLRAPFPANPFNELRTVKVKKTPASPEPAKAAAGWVAVLSTGDFYLNAEQDDVSSLGVSAEKASEIVGKLSAGG